MNPSIETWGKLVIVICMVSRTLQDGDSFDTEIFPLNDLPPNSTIVHEMLYFIKLGIIPKIHETSHFFWYRNDTRNVAADIDNETELSAEHEKFQTNHDACSASGKDYLCKVNSSFCTLPLVSGFVQKFSRPSTYLLQVNKNSEDNHRHDRSPGVDPELNNENCTLRCTAKKSSDHKIKSVSGETVYLTCISPFIHIKQDVTFSWRRDEIEFISSYEGGNVSSLEFRPVKKDDEASYTCCVEGKEDSKSRCYSIFLSVQENKTNEQSKNHKESVSNKTDYLVGVLSENFTLFCAEEKPDLETENETEEDIFFKWLIIIGCIIAFVLLNVGIIIFFYRWKPRSNHMIVKQIVVRIKTSSRDNHEEARLLPDVRIETQRSTKTRKSKSGCAWEYKLPLDEKWEFPREQLNIISDLGVGNFGKVMMGQATSLIHEGVTSIVAVKMLKDSHTDSDMVDLVKEMEIMKIIGKHENVVNFLGCCTQDGPLYVIIEYAEHGSLLNFLRRHRPENVGYELPTNLDLKLNEKLSQKSLISFAYQIARGMEYLSLSRCIHRDLAARNILVSETYIMKIADFGLARDIGMNDYYRKTDDCRLPVKWMAPECINVRKFSSQSDVWSFGILLWEIMTLGEVPYPTYTKLDQLFGLIKLGGRMEKPPLCSPEVYKIMLACWSWNPENRPSFSDLVIRLDKLLTKIADKKYVDLEPSPKNEDDEESTTEETINLIDEKYMYFSQKTNLSYQNTSEVLSDGGFFSDDQQEKNQDEIELPVTEKCKLRRNEELALNYLALLTMENPKKK